MENEEHTKEIKRCEVCRRVNWKNAEGEDFCVNCDEREARAESYKRVLPQSE